MKHVTQDADSPRNQSVGQLTVETIFCSGAGREEAVGDSLGIKVGEIVLSEAAYKELLERLVKPRCEARLFLRLFFF